MKPISQTLTEARATLIEKGWCQDFAETEDGKMCLAQSAWKYETEADVWTLLYTALGGKSLVTWNDTPGRTFEEVLAVYDKAIATALREERLAMVPGLMGKCGFAEPEE